MNCLLSISESDCLFCFQTECLCFYSFTSSSCENMKILQVHRVSPSPKEEIRYVWPSRGSPPAARQRPARRWQHYKVTANTFLFLPVQSHDILTSDAGGEQTRVHCQFIHQMRFTPVDFSMYKWVCLSTPFSHTKLLATSL